MESIYTETRETLLACGTNPKHIINEQTVRFVGKCRLCKTAYAHDVHYNACLVRLDYKGVPHMPPYRPVSRNSPKYQEECCGRRIIFKPVKGQYNPDQPCDGKCLSATGENCSCSCGGANHGSNHLH